VWKIQVPPRLHIFLWLLANDKVLTRDNLTKRRQVEDKLCLFYTKAESVDHVLFECCVAKVVWEMMLEVAGLLVISNFENMAT
jgi:hypothetical protein